MNPLYNRLNSISRVWCFTYSLSAMALSEWELMSDDDPWKVSAFVSATVELFLSILLLLGAAIAFITSRFAKFFGLEPPCTYIGCSHPLHTESFKGRCLPTPPSCKSKDLCIGEFYPDCHPLRVHSKLHSNSGSNQEERSCSERGQKRSAFGSDYNATEQDIDVSSGHSGEHHETCCSCSNSPLYKRRNQRKGPKRTAFARTAFRSKLNEDDLLLLSARSGSESSGGSDAEDHSEISQVPADSDEEWAGKVTYMKKDNGIKDNVSVAHDSEAQKRNVALENCTKKAHGISPSLSKSSQTECAEPSPLYAVYDEGEEPKVPKNNIDKLDSHGAKFADLGKHWPSQCSEMFQIKDNKKGSSNDFDMLASHLSWSLTDGQTKKTQSEREGLHRNGGMVDACKEAHLNARFPAYKDIWNKLVQDVELLDDECQTKNDDDDTKDDIEQGKQEDSGLGNVAMRFGGSILKLIDQKVEDGDCLKKGLVAAYLPTLEPSSQEAIAEGLLEGEKGGIDLNCYLEHGELSMKDPGKKVKDVFDDAIGTRDFPDETVSTNALAQCGSSSKHVEEMALSVSLLEAEDDEEEFILEEEQEEGLEALKMALQAERSVLAALEAELENERNAAAVATSEAMAMISRLQEEKSAMQMKVAQLQRMSEEKADYDEQAMALLKEILFKREKENIALEKEVELYRETLSAEKADELKRNGLSKGAGSPSPQSLKPLLLTGGEEEFLSPMHQTQALEFSEKFYHSGTRSAPWIPQSGPSLDLEELNAFSLDQNVSKRSTDSRMSDTAASTSFKEWDAEERPKYPLNGDLHGPHKNFEQLKKMGRSALSVNDEETQLILERLWVLEEELQKLRGKDGLGSKSKGHEAQQLAVSPTYRRADKSLTESCGGQSVYGLKSEDQREEVEMDGVAEGFIPIHDVYEVHTTSNRSPPFAEERDPPEGFEGTLGNLELPPGSISETFLPARTARHRIQIPPRISQARKLFPSEEAPCTPVFTPQAAGWIVAECSHPEDQCDHQDSRSQTLVLREERHMTKEEIQQLEVRLKALEEDRELLRETLESVKHRDAELNLLQEIAQHLRDLHMAGFMRVAGGVFSEDVSVTSPSKNRALKKRRYCSGPEQAQMLLPQQKSI